MKYHINSNGEPAKCLASKRACPVGGEHFETANEARKHYESGKDIFETVSKNDKYIGYAEIVQANNNAYKREFEEQSIIKNALHNKEHRTIRDALTQNDVNNDAQSKIKNNNSINNFMKSFNNLSSTTKEGIKDMPLQDVSVLLNTHKDKPYANEALENIYKTYESVKKNNPKWSAPEDNGRALTPKDFNNRKPNQAVRIQQMSKSTKALFEEYINQKYSSRASDFWDTVKSKSANSPTINDFYSALRNFK